MILRGSVDNLGGRTGHLLGLSSNSSPLPNMQELAWIGVAPWNSDNPLRYSQGIHFHFLSIFDSSHFFISHLICGICCRIASLYLVSTNLLFIIYLPGASHCLGCLFLLVSPPIHQTCLPCMQSMAVFSNFH